MKFSSKENPLNFDSSKMEDISSHTATNTYKTLQDIIGIDFKTFITGISKH